MTLAGVIGTLPLPPLAIMGLMIALYIVLGAVMDTLAMVLLTVPIFFPVSPALGFDPIWFGVVVVVVCEAGLITPPVGMTVYVLAGIAKTVPGEIFRGVTPFFLADLALLILLMLFPDRALFLPRTMR